MSREHWPVRKLQLKDEGASEERPRFTPEENWAMMWQLALDAWAMRVKQLNPDFRDILSELNAAGVEYLVVGAYAMSAHGYSRSTGDIDIWVRPTPENAVRVLAALRKFGAPLLDLTLTDLHTPDVVFQMGRAPNRVDLLTTISGVDFELAWPNRKDVMLEGIACPVLGRTDLIANKKATGRKKDALDAARLEQIESDVDD